MKLSPYNWVEKNQIPYIKQPTSSPFFMAHLIFHHSLPVCLCFLQQVPVKPGISRIAVVDVNHVILEPKAKLFDFFGGYLHSHAFCTGRFTILNRNCTWAYIGHIIVYHTFTCLQKVMLCCTLLKLYMS